MPYVTSVERMAEERGRKAGHVVGLREGLLQGLDLALRLKFGAQGKKPMPRVRRIENIVSLQALQQALDAATSVEEFRNALS